MIERPTSVSSVFETVLYSKDLIASKAFYGDLLGLKLLSENELMLVFLVEAEHYLLIFNPELSSRCGRLVPSHGSAGPGHIAFKLDPAKLAGWREYLTSQGVTIEAEVEWDKGKRGCSIYVRDPANNSVEFAPPQLWLYLESAGV
jgi:catechol 2,3-dioxygenase-like lactoylglutathione lyase family enzyme